MLTINKVEYDVIEDTGYIEGVNRDYNVQTGDVEYKYDFWINICNNFVEINALPGRGNGVKKITKHIVQ